jgi:glycosyltransferase involved in cell wall biosynthesis
LNPAPVSVIVPAFNAGRTLAATLASIQAQRPSPMQIVVVDDGSTDDTAAVALATTGGWAGSALVRLTNGGVASAMNAGLAAARCDWVAFLDADDLWEPDCLHKQLTHLAAHPGLDASVGGMTEFVCPSLASAEAARLRPRPPQTAWVAGATLVRRTVFSQAGLFNPALRLGCWIDWVDRARRAGATFGEHRGLVMRRRLHPASLSMSQAARDGALLQVARLAIARRRAAA